ncbi:hypothetical protein M426DRAFT_9422 [Hypoxylon sp. CI-4A]|nr:hypothetical protein M426DRAFT_9422 [Hypoxylon sp. CI-4A]
MSDAATIGIISVSPVVGTKKERNRQAVQAWNAYFGRGDLEDWQSLMFDLGFSEFFSSKTQCRKALKYVWVNIVDFLDDVDQGRPTHRFRNQYELGKYTRKHKKFYPRKSIPKGSPLRRLLANVCNP